MSYWDNSKTETVRFRLTALEKEQLLKAAASSGLSLSDYIRFCCHLDSTVESPQQPLPPAGTAD